MMAGERGRGGAAVACTAEQTHLGEGARWDDRRSELLRVDIVAGRVYRDRVQDDGALVQRYSPDGVLREALAVRARQSTCCAFGGPRLHRLYVTTATENWSDERRRAEPGAGLVYRLDPDATGRPAAPFRPDPAWWSEFIR
jgi:sugar lactone lactonase YvrE